MNNNPPDYLRDLVEESLGKKTVLWSAPDCGLSSAHRFSVQIEGNHRVFVKAATDAETEQWLRTEHFVLTSMQEKFMPRVISWIDKPGIRPILLSEDLSHAYWPASHKGVSWRDNDLGLLFSCIKELSTFKAPAQLAALQNRNTLLWPKIYNNADAFLRLKLCSARWLEQSIDALTESEKIIDLSGNCLIHGDIRSDNICVLNSQIIFVDWSHAARGNGRHNMASVLPAIHLEGGSHPHTIMSDGGSEAALLSSAHIWRIFKDRSMPQWLQNVFRKLIAIELEWVARCLGLDEPDGVKWRTI